MRSLFILMFLSQGAFAEAVVTRIEAAHQGWWCYAKAQSGEQVLAWGSSLESAKNKARKDCSDQFGACQITQCYEDNPYKYTCIAGLPEGETRVGGFRAFSNDEEAARRTVEANCYRQHGCGCVSLCYPNFSPPRK